MNQRIIKFRAWDKRKKEMIPQLGWTNKPQFFVVGNKCWELSKELKGKTINLITTLLEINEDLIPMQYTELKDKNGKEIYEGDVIKTKYGYLVVICWEDGGYIYSNDHLPENIKKQMKDGHFIACNFCCSEDEIIGNIYENPELYSEGL